MLETVESDFDVSSVAASEHPDGNIDASSSPMASRAGTMGFGRPELIVPPCSTNTELPSKAQLAGGISMDGTGCSENSDLGNSQFLLQIS